MSEKIKYEYEIPVGWSLVEFPQTFQSVSLNGIKIKQKQYQQNGKYPVVDQGQDLIGGYYDNDELVVSGNPPFVIFGDHTKVKKYVNFKFIAGADGVKVLKPYSLLDPKLFFYFLHCIKLPDKGYARHYQFLSDADFPLPPLAEQHRIVAKIEELFSSLDKGIESLKTAQAQLKTYRQAVLKWAFEGKLTNENVKDGELPEGWKWEKLTSIASAIDPQPSHRTPPIDINGVPYVGIGDVDFEKGVFNFENARRVSKKVLDEHKERYSLENGDFVIGKIGTIGKPFKIPIERFYTLSANIVLIKPNAHLCSGDYLFYLSSSNIIEKQFKEGSKATTQAAFGIKKVRTLRIPLPPNLVEQKNIVAEIEKRLSVCDKLEESIEQSLSQAEALRQSILKKAFEGKLVPQDPSDEPASVLLEKIKTDRALRQAQGPKAVVSKKVTTARKRRGA